LPYLDLHETATSLGPVRSEYLIFRGPPRLRSFADYRSPSA